MNHRDLVKLTLNEKSAIEYLMSNNFIENYKDCSTCFRTPLLLSVKNSRYIWQCTRCKNCISVFKGTLFYRSKLKTTALLDLIYFWCVDITQNKARVEIESKSKHTSCNWYKNCKIFCTISCLN